MTLRLPTVGSRVVDPGTGLMNRDWYLALLNIASTVTGANVSSVNIAGNNGITVAGSPITTAGVITLGIGNLTCASAVIAGSASVGGTLTAANVVGTAAVQTVNIAATGTITCVNAVASASVQTVNLSASGTVTSANAINTGTLTTANAIITNTATALNVVINGSMTFAGNVANSLGGNVNLTSTSAYFDGPSVSVGAVGTWYVSGTATVVDSSAAAQFIAKLWDGTSVIASCIQSSHAAGFQMAIPLSGAITTPAGNLRISVRDFTTTSGKVIFNDSGNSKDSTITAYRIA